MEFITKNSDETQALGSKIGSALKGGEIIAFIGQLGAGKTTFIQGLTQGLGIVSPITSPTFIIMRTYAIPPKTGISAEHLYHVDLYRLETNVSDEAQNLGILDLWGKEESIFLIEWADHLDTIPEKSITISIEVLDENTRKFTMSDTISTLL